MKKNTLTLAVLTAVTFSTAVYANDQVKVAAPSVQAPKVAAPRIQAPSALRNASSGESASEAEAVELKMPDIAKVTHGHYTQAHVDALVKNFTARGQHAITPQVKEMIRNNLISQALVVEQAHKSGIADHPDVKAQIDLVTDNILVGAYLSDYFKQHPVTEADAKKEYDTLVAQNAGMKEYKTRHILVEKEEDAKKIIAQLKKGASFEKLAKEDSKDEGSKTKGGELGWAVPQETFVKPFAEAVMSLKKGQITQTPVKSQFGYHVIELEDVRTAKAPAFDQVKAGIMEKLKAKKLQDLVTSLRDKK